MRHEARPFDQRAEPGQHRRPGYEPVPEDVDLALRRLGEPHQHAQCRGLAGSVRPEQSEHLARPHLQVELRDRDERAVLLAQSAYDQRHVRVLGPYGEHSTPTPAPGQHHDRHRAEREDHDENAERPPPRAVRSGLLDAVHRWQRDPGAARDAAEGHRIDGRGGRRRVRLVRRRDGQPQRVAGLEPVDDRRQRHGHRLWPRRCERQTGQPDRRDQSVGQREASGRVDVVELDEDDGRAGRRRDLDRDARRADDVDRLSQWCRVEVGVLAGYVGGDAAHERCDPTAARTGQRADRRGRAVGRVRGRLRRTGHGDLRRRLTAQTRIRRYVEGQRDDAVGVRVQPGDPGVAERVRRSRAGALEVVVEPLVGEVVQPILVGLRSGAAVVAAGEPGHPYGRAVRGEPARVGIRLGQREQAVRLALDQQRRRLDPVEHAGRAGSFEQRDVGRCGRAGRCDRQIGPADIGGEPPAGRVVGRRGRIGQARAPVERWCRSPEAGRRRGRAAAAEKQTGPRLLEHAVARRAAIGGRQERRRQVVPRDHRDDRVDPLVVRREEQREPAAVRAADGRHPRIVRNRSSATSGRRGEPVDQLGAVLDLPVGTVQVDLAAAGAEALGRPRQDRVAPARQVLRPARSPSSSYPRNRAPAGRRAPDARRWPTAARSRSCRG